MSDEKRTTGKAYYSIWLFGCEMEKRLPWRFRMMMFCDHGSIPPLFFHVCVLFSYVGAIWPLALEKGLKPVSGLFRGG